MSDTLVEVRNGIGFLTLNRPAALNALTFDMLKAVRAQLEAWERDRGVAAVVLRGAGEKAFCAGGDVRAVRERFLSGSNEHEGFFAFEYALDHYIHHYPKPVIALMRGIIMGGGMGLAQGAKLRIATDTTRMAMPETHIGLFPDVGGSYFLSRLPGELGAYLGLTGHHVRTADVMYCGLADIYLAGDYTSVLEAAMRATPQALLDILRAQAAPPPTPAPLAAVRAALDHHFALATVPQILASLESEQRDGYREWAQTTLETLNKRSPLMLCVTLEQLRRGKRLSLADCFRMELNMIYRCFEAGDFLEGVRALLVDKDNAPRWRHARVEEVQASELEAFFAPRWDPSSHPLRALN